MQVSKRLLLASNSTMFGRGYLDHLEDALRALFGNRRHVAFVPWALADRAGYAAKAAERFAALGYDLRPLDEGPSSHAAFAAAEALFVGGGNTFRLLRALQRSGLVPAIRERVASGMPYFGSSAGAIVAGPTIKTTKDMPIVEPETFEALSLVHFQISPHYLDPDPHTTHMGETQAERIAQFLEENDAPVVGLREGAFLEIEPERVRLCGSSGARLFRRGQEIEVAPGADLTAWLRAEVQA